MEFSDEQRREERRRRRLVENLSDEQRERKRKRDLVENMSEERRETHRAGNRVEGMSAERLETHRAANRSESMSAERLETHRAANRYESMSEKRWFAKQQGDLLCNMSEERKANKELRAFEFKWGQIRAKIARLENVYDETVCKLQEKIKVLGMGRQQWDYEHPCTYCGCVWLKANDRQYRRGCCKDSAWVRQAVNSSDGDDSIHSNDDYLYTRDADKQCSDYLYTNADLIALHWLKQQLRDIKQLRHEECVRLLQIEIDNDQKMLASESRITRQFIESKNEPYDPYNFFIRKFVGSVANRLPNWFARGIQADRCDPVLVRRNICFESMFTRKQAANSVNSFSIPWNSFESNEDEHDLAAWMAYIECTDPNLFESMEESRKLYGTTTILELFERLREKSREERRVQNKRSVEECAKFNLWQRQSYVRQQEEWRVRNKWSAEESMQFGREYEQECERVLGPDRRKNMLAEQQQWRETYVEGTRSLQLNQWRDEYHKKSARSLGDLSMRYTFVRSGTGSETIRHNYYNDCD